MCLNGILPCVDFMDVIMGDIPASCVKEFYKTLWEARVHSSTTCGEVMNEPVAPPSMPLTNQSCRQCTCELVF